MLYGPSLRNDRLDALLDYLRTCEPVERTTCFFIYRFPPPPKTEHPPARARAAADR
jgi:hypothetical protein